jgi:hypothetical protein
MNGKCWKKLYGTRIKSYSKLCSIKERAQAVKTCALCELPVNAFKLPVVVEQPPVCDRTQEAASMAVTRIVLPVT